MFPFNNQSFSPSQTANHILKIWKFPSSSLLKKQLIWPINLTFQESWPVDKWLGHQVDNQRVVDLNPGPVGPLGKPFHSQLPPSRSPSTIKGQKMSGHYGILLFDVDLSYTVHNELKRLPWQHWDRSERFFVVSIDKYCKRWQFYNNLNKCCQQMTELQEHKCTDYFWSWSKGVLILSWFEVYSWAMLAFKPNWWY